jgi:MarR family transcriptional regulator, transcriptional regulator for hemolysin
MDGKGLLGTSAERLLALVHHASGAARQLRRLLDELAGTVQLSDSELLVVWMCCHPDGLAQVALAGAIGVSPAQMSGIVERLGRRGLIAMQRSPLDRRRQVWRTTPAGRELGAALQARLSALAADLDGAVSPEDQNLVLSVCRRLAAAAVNMHVAASSEHKEAA